MAPTGRWGKDETLLPFDASFFLRLSGIELDATGCEQLARLSPAEQVHGVVKLLVERGLAPDTSASARMVSRLACVLSHCRAALAAQPPLKPPTPHEAGTLLLLANQRRLFFEQKIGLASFAEAAQLSAYGELVRTPLVLGAQHFQAIHRTLLQPESRLLAALAASLRCTLARAAAPRSRGLL